MIQPPNSWASLGTSYWTVTGGVAVDLWGLLEIKDTLGQRPYTAAAGATFQATFQRGEVIGVSPTGNPASLVPNGLSVVKTLVFDAQNRSLVKIPLTLQDATNIISGTISFTLTEGAAVNKWLANWAVKKLNTTAGL